MKDQSTHALIDHLDQWEEEVWQTIENDLPLVQSNTSRDETIHFPLSLDFFLDKSDEEYFRQSHTSQKMVQNTANLHYVDCTSKERNYVNFVNSLDSHEFSSVHEGLTNSQIFRIGELVIEGQLKRYPLGMLSIGALSQWGEPLVVITRPLVDKKTPFPTTFYLTHPCLVKAVSRLEATGVMTKLSAVVEKNIYIQKRYQLAHHIYLDFRKKLGNLLGDSQQHLGDRTAGGLPTRVKCLHALVAQSLVMGPGVNPIGDWTLHTIGSYDLCREEINSLQSGSFDGFSYDVVTKIFSHKLKLPSPMDNVSFVSTASQPLYSNSVSAYDIKKNTSTRLNDCENGKKNNEINEENKKIYYYRLLLGKIFLKYTSSWVRRISCNFDITKEYDQEEMIKCINEDLKSM